ncbi:MAG: hypothetical protein MR710_08080 [Bacteroidales bacterium]|nr:hypothetical protein [Bacteroidales bacterium]
MRVFKFVCYGIAIGVSLDVGNGASLGIGVNLGICDSLGICVSLGINSCNVHGAKLPRSS